MANLSDAEVDIVADKVGQELLDYINTTNKDTIDYAIVYEGFDEHVNANGDFVISGNSSGRWAYSNNLEGYFDAERVKQWLGVGDDYKWLEDEAKKKQYQTNAQEQYAAYLRLVAAIKKTGGRVEINYTDADPAMGWMSSGQAVLEVEDGEVVFSHHSESEDLDITKYADINGLSIYEALETLHGDEVADKWAEYEEMCEKNGGEKKDPQVWYDEDFEWE